MNKISLISSATINTYIMNFKNKKNISSMKLSETVDGNITFFGNIAIYTYSQRKGKVGNILLGYIDKKLHSLNLFKIQEYIGAGLYTYTYIKEDSRGYLTLNPDDLSEYLAYKKQSNSLHSLSKIALKKNDNDMSLSEMWVELELLKMCDYFADEDFLSEYDSLSKLKKDISKDALAVQKSILKLQASIEHKWFKIKREHSSDYAFWKNTTEPSDERF